jgi:hypothetical protein
MKTAGAVFRRLKNTKFRYLQALYHQYLKQSPGNCKYNYQYRFCGNDGKLYTIGLCLLHQSTGVSQPLVPHLMDVCQEQKDCQYCNAYVPKYTRDQIKDFFEQELLDKKIKAKKYPDICALEWVLERDISTIGLYSHFRSFLYKILRF